MNKPESGPWAVVGKISLLVATLGGIIVLYDRGCATDYNIEAQGEFAPFVLPQPVIQELNDKLTAAKNVNAYFIINVQNEGNKEITGMNLELPGEGYYSIYRPGQGFERGEFERTIAIGALRPSNSLEVELGRSIVT